MSLSSICILFIRDQKTRGRKKERKKERKRQKDVEKEEKNIKRGGASTKYNKIRMRKMREEVEVEVVITEEKKGGN